MKIPRVLIGCPQSLGPPTLGRCCRCVTRSPPPHPGSYSVLGLLPMEQPLPSPLALAWLAGVPTVSTLLIAHIGGDACHG